MPPQKTRNKKMMRVDIALSIRLDQFRKQWELMFGEPISEIEMTKIFGEYGNIDLKIVKEMRKNGL
jgi:hypothetical protein